MEILSFPDTTVPFFRSYFPEFFTILYPRLFFSVTEISYHTYPQIKRGKCGQPEIRVTVHPTERLQIRACPHYLCILLAERLRLKVLEIPHQITQPAAVPKDNVNPAVIPGVRYLRTI